MIEATGSRRVILIVLDGVGLGPLPDAGFYGDQNCATLPHVALACGGLHLPHLQKLGLGHVTDIAGVPPTELIHGGYGKLCERGAGKDSTTGHWELLGVILDKPFATYPQGFPEELVNQFAEAIGIQPIGNVPASGISVLKEFGGEHLRTGRPILYTSVDSVFQIAAHEEVIPLHELYEICRKARLLVDSYHIGRVIARPFLGNEEQGFRRTAKRKDFSMPPPSQTVLERLESAGISVVGIGKINDLFAGRGVSTSVSTEDNDDGMHKTLMQLAELDYGLLVVNLIDFDMVYGHRQDTKGFGRALEEFDAWLPLLFDLMKQDDLVVICADHGCDPTTPGTDHTREFAPVLAWMPKLRSAVNLGTRDTFADVGATINNFFGLPQLSVGDSFWETLHSRAVSV